MFHPVIRGNQIRFERCGLGEILIRGLAVLLVSDEILVELGLLRDGGLELGLKNKKLSRNQK